MKNWNIVKKTTSARRQVPVAPGLAVAAGWGAVAVGAAVERADEAARLDSDARYAEPVELYLSSAAGLNLEMWLTDDSLHLSDGKEMYRTSQPISGAAATTHSGTIKLAGGETVWVVLDAGQVTIQVEQPGF